MYQTGRIERATSDSPSAISYTPVAVTDSGLYNNVLHLDDVYHTLISAAMNMEERVKTSLEVYANDPDVQANLQQLQYDLQSWNLALTTMTNMHKNMADALKSIVGNLR